MSCYDLVFNGGGAKGLAFVGALEALAEAGDTHGRLVGTSAGAITAVFTAAGYGPDELHALCTAVDPETGQPVMAGFLDAPEKADFSPEQITGSLTHELLAAAHLPELVADELLSKLLDSHLYRELFSFNECGGFFAGDKALAWFRSSLAAKGFDPNVNWRDFHTRTGVDVSLVTTNVTHSQMVVLNHRTAPDCPVASSMRMSMSIPMLWREVVWDPEAWGLYLGRPWPPEPPPAGDPGPAKPIFVDGGVLSNFALALLTDGDDPDVQAVMGVPAAAAPGGAGAVGGNVPPLGLFLDHRQVVEGAEQAPRTQQLQLRAAARVAALIDTMTEAHDIAAMERWSGAVCRLPVGGFGTTEFRMTAARQQLLIASGKQAMEGWLATQGG